MIFVSTPLQGGAQQGNWLHDIQNITLCVMFCQGKPSLNTVSAEKSLL